MQVDIGQKPYVAKVPSGMEITTAEEQRDYKSLTASLKILPAQLFGGKKCISLTLGSQKWLTAKAIKEKPWKESHPGPAITLWVSREQGIRLPSLFCCCVWNRADSEEGLSHNCVALDKERMGAEQSSRMNLHGYYFFHRREMEAERSLVFFYKISLLRDWEREVGEVLIAQ